MRNAEFEMRNGSASVIRYSTFPFNSAFHIPHSAFGWGGDAEH